MQWDNNSRGGWRIKRAHVGMCLEQCLAHCQCSAICGIQLNAGDQQPRVGKTRCQSLASEGGAVIPFSGQRFLDPPNPTFGASSKSFAASEEGAQPSPSAAHRLGQSQGTWFCVSLPGSGFGGSTESPPKLSEPSSNSEYQSCSRFCYVHLCL